MRTVLFALLPEVVLLDVASAAEPFRIANQYKPGSYQLRFAGPAPALRSAMGLQLAELEPLPSDPPAGSIVVVTGVSTEAFDIESIAARTLAAWLEQIMCNETITLMCVCTGSLVAARAGLLRGRECTTHHGYIEMLARLEPGARVHADRIFVEDGRVLTSAGVTAGADLTLHLIGQQLGHRVAAAVARELVVYMRRAGADPQLSPWLMHRNHIHPAVHRVQDAIARNPAGRWTSARLAAVGCMSPRHLTRLFAEHAGCSPLDYVHRLRIAMARELVSNSTLALERVAERTGFSSAQQLRRVWRRWETLPPAVLRAGASGSPRPMR